MHKEPDRGWKTKKREDWPDLGTYKDKDKAYKITLKSSPTWKVNHVERKTFTYRRKEDAKNPGPGTYDFNPKVLNLIH